MRNEPIPHMRNLQVSMRLAADREHYTIAFHVLAISVQHNPILNHYEVDVK